MLPMLAASQSGLLYPYISQTIPHQATAMVDVWLYTILQAKLRAERERQREIERQLAKQQKESERAEKRAEKEAAREEQKKEKAAARKAAKEAAREAGKDGTAEGEEEMEVGCKCRVVVATAYKTSALGTLRCWVCLCVMVLPQMLLRMPARTIKQMMKNGVGGPQRCCHLVPIELSIMRCTAVVAVSELHWMGQLAHVLFSLVWNAVVTRRCHDQCLFLWQQK